MSRDHYASGSARHSFTLLMAVHESGGIVAGCRCGVELLVIQGRPRKYRSNIADAWTTTNRPHVEKPEAREVVVGSDPGNFPVTH